MNSCPHCGCDLDDAPKHTRSVPQNKRLHALCRAVYEHWPEDGFGVFKPKSKEHLRRWLIVQTGRFHLKPTIRVTTTDPQKIYALLRAVLDDSDNEDTFIDIEDDAIIRKVADSTAFDKLDHYATTKLYTEIDNVIEAYGFNAAQLLEEAKNAVK